MISARFGVADGAKVEGPFEKKNYIFRQVFHGAT